MTTPRIITYPLGNWLYVWEVSASGGIDALIAQARAMKMAGLNIKAFDGSSAWPQFSASAAAVKAAGLRLGAWGYTYGSNLLQTAEAAKAAVTAGAEYVIFDAEVEFEAPTGTTDAAMLGSHVRALMPDVTIGYTTFALPDDHAQFPYAQFSQWCDFAMPQVYWADAGMQPQAMLAASVQQLSGFGKRIFPVGQAYPAATTVEVAEFGAACAERWIEGVSWWDAQSSTAELRAAVAQVEVYTPKPPAPVRYQVVTGWFDGTAQGCPAADAAAERIKALGWNSWVQKV